MPQVWRDTFQAAGCGSEADRWLSRFLRRDVRLARLLPLPLHTRRIEAAYAPPDTEPDIAVGFADGFPLLLTSEASLADLNARLTDPVDMVRFRPNIVVGGGGMPPFDEDHWRRIRIGTTEFAVVKPCARCTIPTVLPAAGRKSADGEPIRTLRTYRQDAQGDVFFGMNAVHLRAGGRIAVGDAVVVLERDG